MLLATLEHANHCKRPVDDVEIPNARRATVMRIPAHQYHFAHRKREGKLDMLRQHRAPPRELTGREIADGFPLVGHLPTRRLQESRRDLQQRRLPRSIGTQDHVEAAAAKSRGDIVQVVNTPRKLQSGNGWTDWNMSWEQWLQGSAIDNGPASSAPVSPSASA